MAKLISYILISVGLLVLSLILGIVFYQIGYSNGNEYGYRSGYQSGIISDNETAWQDGYSIGYIDGFEDDDPRLPFSVSSRFSTLDSFPSVNSTRQGAWDRGWDKGIEEMVGKCDGDNKDLYSTKNIDLDKLQLFLYLDQTSNIPYSDDFNCLGYALTLKTNATKQGIRCAVVIIYYRKTVLTYTDKYGDEKTIELNTKDYDKTIGHAINAFELPNKSIIYIEPQTDGIVHDLEEDQPYDPIIRGRHYKPWSFADSVMKIVTIW